MRKKKKDKRVLIAIIVVLVVVFVLFSMWIIHFMHAMIENPRLSFSEIFPLATPRMLSRPFDIFPIPNGAFGVIGIATAVIAMFAYFEYDQFAMRKHDDPDTVNGTAHFMTEEEENEYNLKYSEPYGQKTYDGFNNMILTRDIRLGLDGKSTKRNCNILVVGGSGAGKSRYFAGPNILQANCSFVVTDPSGELLESYGKFLENEGFQVKTFNLIDVYRSNQYNPFVYINSEKDVFILVNTLIKNTTPPDKHGGDPFWENSEKALLNALILYLWKYCPKKDQTFSNVMKLLYMANIDENDSSSKSPLDRIFDDIRAQDPESLAVNQYDIFKMGAGKTLKSILISVGVRLQSFTLSDIKYLAGADNLELDKFGDSKQALFVILPTGDMTFNFLASLMYSQLFMSLYTYVETRAKYGWMIQMPDTTPLRVVQATSPEDSLRAKEEVEKLYKEIQKGLVTKFNKEKQYFEIKTKKGKLISWRGTKEQCDKFLADIHKAQVVQCDMELPIHCRLILDEFANIGQIPDFNLKLSTVRKYRISCSIILQAISQIKEMYKDSWQTLVGNCDTYLYLGGNDAETAKDLVDKFGKRTTVVENTSWNSTGETGSTSYNRSSVELMAVNDILKMKDDECVCIVRGESPYYGKKYDLLSHPNFKTAMSTKGTFKPHFNRAMVTKKEAHVVVGAHLRSTANSQNVLSNNAVQQKQNKPVPLTNEEKAVQEIRNSLQKEKAKEMSSNTDSRTGKPIIEEPEVLSDEKIKEAFHAYSKKSEDALIANLESVVEMDEFGPEEMVFSVTE